MSPYPVFGWGTFVGEGSLGAVATHIHGGREVLIQDHLIEASIDLSTNEVSQVTLGFYDPVGELRDGPYFPRRTIFNYAGFYLEVAAREMTSVAGRPGLRITGRSAAAQAMKRLRGPLVRRDISPTNFMGAEAHYLNRSFVGEPSPNRTQIVRAVADPAEGGENESSWDVGTRLAREVGYVFFEAAETFYFARPSWLLNRLPKIAVTWTGESRTPPEPPTVRAKTAPQLGPAGARLLVEYEDGSAVYEGGWTWDPDARTYGRRSVRTPPTGTGPGGTLRLGGPYEDGSAVYENGWAWDPDTQRFVNRATRYADPSTDFLIGVPALRDSDNDTENGITGSLLVHPMKARELMPGRAIDLGGVGVYSRPYLVTALRLDLRGVQPATVTIATPEDPRPQGEAGSTPSTASTHVTQPRTGHRLTAEQLSALPDAERFAYEGPLPVAPPGYVWAEDRTLVPVSFYRR